MPLVPITDEAMRAIRSMASQYYKSDAQRQPDGMWLVPLEDETVERCQRLALPGESISDTIVRAIARQRGQVS